MKFNLLVQSRMKQLQDAGLLQCHDVVMLHPYYCQTVMGSLASRRDAEQLQWAYSHLKAMMSLARAMGYLVRMPIQFAHVTNSQ